MDDGDLDNTSVALLKAIVEAKQTPIKTLIDGTIPESDLMQRIKYMEKHGLVKCLSGEGLGVVESTYEGKLFLDFSGVPTK